MKIVEIRVLRGPNFWSIRRPNLIQMKLDLEEMEYRPTNKVEGFRERIEQLLPSLIEHRCSEGHRGGFFKRVEDGTWMGHVIEHIALEIQALAGMDCGFGRTRSTGEKEGVYFVAFDYEVEKAGLYTALASVRIAQALIDGKAYDVARDIKKLREILEETKSLPPEANVLPGNIQRFHKETDWHIPLTETSNALPAGHETSAALFHIASHVSLSGNGAEKDLAKFYTTDSNRHIPIIAITGATGLSPTSQITAHILQTAWKKVGHSTSNGVYIQNQLLKSGNGSGYDAARVVLKNPTVEVAILECAPEGILMEGLGFRQCELAIVTDIDTNSLTLDGITTIERLVRLKQVVPETVTAEGYAVLNADDDHVYSMRNELRCRIALFSLAEENPRIKEHCEGGGMAVVFENGYITLVTGIQKVQVIAATAIPLTNSGKDKHIISNALPAVLAAYLLNNIPVEDIRKALQTLKALVPDNGKMVQ